MATLASQDIPAYRAPAMFADQVAQSVRAAYADFRTGSPPDFDCAQRDLLSDNDNLDDELGRMFSYASFQSNASHSHEYNATITKYTASIFSVTYHST
jgi:hypothetical protein